MTTTPIEHSISRCDADVDTDRPGSPCSVCDYIEDETGRRPAECCSKEGSRYEVTIVTCSEPDVTTVPSPVVERDCSSDSSFDDNHLSLVNLNALATKLDEMEKKQTAFIESFSQRMQIFEERLFALLRP